jgi:hypothetical protein
MPAIVLMPSTAIALKISQRRWSSRQFLGTFCGRFRPLVFVLGSGAQNRPSAPAGHAEEVIKIPIYRTSYFSFLTLALGLSPQFWICPSLGVGSRIIYWKSAETHFYNVW